MTSTLPALLAHERPTQPGSSLDVIVRPGATAQLPEVVSRWRPRRVTVIGTQRALSESGVPTLLEGHRVSHFSSITPNPTERSVIAAAQAIEDQRPDVLVAVGGGSTLDVAKAARVLSPDRDRVLAALNGCTRSLRGDVPPLVLLPTTAGSGSEVTQFATIYVDGRKHSLDDARVRADVALVDPERTYSCPPSVTYPSAFDALAHAAESLWSNRSSPRSRELAAAALGELAKLTLQPLDEPTAEQRHRLAVVATVAGQAIDLSRTTAAHAFSYWLTAQKGVPHGLACVLNLAWLIPYNARHAPAAARGQLAQVHRALGWPSTDPAGPDAAESAAVSLRGRIQRAGYPLRLRDYGLSHGDLAPFVAAGLSARARTSNNPAPLCPDDVRMEVARHY